MNNPFPNPKKPILVPADLHKQGRKRTKQLAVLALVALAVLVALKLGSDKEMAAVNAKVEAAREAAKENNVALTDVIRNHPGGMSTNAQQLELVKRVGAAFAEKTDAQKKAVRLNFHLLAEPNGINIFALSDGNIYITTALVNRMQTEGELAAAMAHAVAHAMVGDGLTAPAMPQTNKLVLPNYSYTVDQERKADILAIKLMGQAGYDPNAMINMLTVLANAYQAGADVSYFITHPNEENRLNTIDAAINAAYPDGIPSNLSK